MSSGDSDKEDQCDLSEEQMSELEEAFAVFDTDGAGVINTRKLFRVMRALGQNPTEAEVQDLIDAVDDDGNGTIELEEFVSMMAQKVKEPDSEDDLKQAFKVFDSKHGGGITSDDLQAILSSMGQSELTQQQVQEMIEQADTQENGNVSLEDFMKLYLEGKDS